MNNNMLAKNLDDFLIYSTKYFDIKHVNDVLLPGYLIIYAKNPVMTIADMSDEESQELISFIKKSQIAIQKIIQPEKIYLLSFCELLPQFHLHLFPRTKELAKQFREAHSQSNDTVINGPLLVDWSRKNFVMQDMHADVEKIIREIRAEF